jgi:hypothetical protein
MVFMKAYARSGFSRRATAAVELRRTAPSPSPHRKRLNASKSTFGQASDIAFAEIVRIEPTSAIVKKRVPGLRRLQAADARATAVISIDRTKPAVELLAPGILRISPKRSGCSQLADWATAFAAAAAINRRILLEACSLTAGSDRRWARSS